MEKPAAPRVFISYASADQAPADAVSGALEAHGISCWIAHRDNEPGLSWDEGILRAIETVDAVVLILTANSNASAMVKAEVERARNKSVPILPVRVENVKPARGLELFISSLHWLDAFTPPIEQYFERLVHSVRKLLKDVDPYLTTRLGAYQAYSGPPRGTWEELSIGTHQVADLRVKLVVEHKELEQPLRIRVRGTLFPCALLSSGWWDKQSERRFKDFEWQGGGLQKWLFNGFDLWGPSWDVNWDFLNTGQGLKSRYCIAQLGEGDEANSIPVLVPVSKAPRLQDVFKSRWGGTEAEVQGVLGHRKHFANYVDPNALELFGGLLDYCLCLEEDNKDHVVTPKSNRTDLYSGYLWKCVVPKSFLSGVPCIDNVFFVWEHVNFADGEALKYCLDAITHKERYIADQFGELLLVHKSSPLVPGTPAYSAEAVYQTLLGKSGDAI